MQQQKLSRSKSAVLPFTYTHPPTLQTNFTVALVGSARSGKTQFCKVLADGVFEESYTPTTFDTYFCSIKDEETVKNFNLFDIGSTEETKSHRTVIYPSCDAILLCFAIDDKESLLHTEEFIKEIRENSGGVDIPVILVGTKTDLRESEHHHHHHPAQASATTTTSSGGDTLVPLIALDEPYEREVMYLEEQLLVPSSIPPLNFSFVTTVIPKLVDEIAENGSESSRSIGSARSTECLSSRDDRYITKTRGVRHSGKIRAHTYMECSAKLSAGIHDIVKEVITLAEFCQTKKLQQIEKAQVDPSPRLKKRSNSFFSNG